MAWFGAVMNIVSAVSGVAGGVADGQASAAQRAYGAKLSRENAKLTGDQSAMQETAQRRESDQLLGAQRAAIAESGTGVGGSNGLIAAQDAALAELDALTTRYEGRLRMTDLDREAAVLGEERMTAYQRLMGRKGIGMIGSVASSQRVVQAFGGQNRAW